jgi:hypothetical protein
MVCPQSYYSLCVCVCACMRVGTYVMYVDYVLIYCMYVKMYLFYIYKMKNSSETMVNWTRDLPACSTVPQPSVLPLASHIYRINTFWSFCGYRIQCNFFWVGCHVKMGRFPSISGTNFIPVIRGCWWFGRARVGDVLVWLSAQEGFIRINKADLSKISFIFPECICVCARAPTNACRIWSWLQLICFV